MRRLASRFGVAALLVLSTAGYGSCGSSLHYSDARGRSITTLIVTAGEEESVRAVLQTDITEVTIVEDARFEDPTVAELVAIEGDVLRIRGVGAGQTSLVVTAGLNYGRTGAYEREQTLTVRVAEPPDRSALVGRWVETVPLQPLSLELREDGAFVAEFETRPDGCTGTWSLEGHLLALVPTDHEPTVGQVMVDEGGLLLTTAYLCRRFLTDARLVPADR